MILKDTKQLGNFRRGINLYVPKKRIVSAAPSGIPVATPSSVIVAGSPDGFNGTYEKILETQWQQIIDPNKQIIWDSEDVGIPNRWSLANFDTNFYVTHQTWSDQTQIPASGWPNGETITAALAPAVTTSVCVNGAGVAASNGTYTYAADKGYWIRASSFEWRVGYNVGSNQNRWGIAAWFMGNILVGEYYYNNTPLAASANPPLNGWVVNNSFQATAGSAPSITYGSCT